MTSAFVNNTQVAFGDINLSQEPIRGIYSPGAGGWPTIRYFNWLTGYEGAPYPKKTPKSMCDELGDIKYMTVRRPHPEAGSLAAAAVALEPSLPMAAAAPPAPPHPAATRRTPLAQDYVTEFGVTSACSIGEPSTCAAKELEYLAKQTELDAEALAEALARLKKMAKDPMTPTLKAWLGSRAAILAQLAAKKAEPPKDEL